MLATIVRLLLLQCPIVFLCSNDRDYDVEGRKTGSGIRESTKGSIFYHNDGNKTPACFREWCETFWFSGRSQASGKRRLRLL
jgi:hypothetical protein